MLELTRIVFGTDSEVLDVGRARRILTPAQRKAVIAQGPDPVADRAVTRRHASASAPPHPVAAPAVRHPSRTAGYSAAAVTTGSMPMTSLSLTRMAYGRSSRRRAASWRGLTLTTSSRRDGCPRRSRSVSSASCAWSRVRRCGMLQACIAVAGAGERPRRTAPAFHARLRRPIAVRIRDQATDRPPAMSRSSGRWRATPVSACASTSSLD